MNLRDRFDLDAYDPVLGEADARPEAITSTGGYAVFDSLPPFACVNAGSVAEAVSLLKTHGDQAALIAGGQDLLRRLRGRVHAVAPRVLINIKTVHAGLDDIREADGGVLFGSLVTLRGIESNPIVRERYPMLANAAYTSGVLQYRNLATLGGDLCQQVRCWYYLASGNAYHCRRKGGSQCPALDGDNRYHAIFGSRDCVATCPSDTAPALIALGARVHIAGSHGERTVFAEEFFTPRGNVLGPDEMVTGVHLPAPEAGVRGIYEKFSRGNVFDPAVASIAVVAQVQDGVCHDARIVLGAVSPQPWRAALAERKLDGKRLDASSAAKVAQAAVADAWPLEWNGYKVDVARILTKRAILALAADNSKPA